jgi:uncharacterized protein YbjT (DUF2867 family)
VAAVKVLVAGASGFVGRRLCAALAEAGHDVVAMTRNPAGYTGAGRPVHGDVHDPATLGAAMAGCQVAYYLVHSLSDADFERKDAAAAAAFGEAGARAGLQQVIYLGGLGDDKDALSAHLRSRREVEKLLGSAGVPVTVIRAGIIVGHGGISWELTRQLVDHLPAMITPRWVSTRTQPIAVDDIVRYLLGVLALPQAAGRVFEAGGPEILQYVTMLRREGGQSRAAAALRADPKIAGYTRGGFTNVRIGRLKLLALAADGSGPTRPVITAGAAPAAGDEVALGASTLRDAHTAIGRTVDLVLDQAGGHPKPVRMRVVGTVIVPPTPFQAVRPGEGAAVALPGLARIDPDATRQPGGLPFLVRFAPGVSRAAGLAAVANDIKRLGLPRPYITAAERPAAMTSLASIAGLPAALAGLLALIAAGTLAHTLASSTRRKRRDLAVLKTLGFTRRQIRHATAWQATTITAIALLIGLPTGIAGGRWAWRVFATQLGVLPEPAVPLTTIALAIPAALAVANLIAAAPAQAAAHTQPAAVLRSE